jgi:PAB1-binding protein PBP1
MEREIMSTSTNNPHVLEERGLNIFGNDKNVNEEDMYG